MTREASQRDLDFMEGEQARRRRDRAKERETFIDRNLATPLERLGPKHFADQLGLGVEKVHRVYHWKERREGQRPPAELLMAAHEEDEEAFGDYAEELGYERPKRKSRLPPEVERDELIKELKRMGFVGEQIIAKVGALRMPREQQEWEKPPLRPNGKRP
jgi:hypothetical protein